MPYPSRQRCEESSSNAKSALYTQFCIGVELGDDTLVRDLVVRGADTMVSYGVDGVITTPIHSALTKGDVPMTLALLTSRSTKVRLADLDSAPRIKRELVTPLLVQRLSIALEDGAKDLLLQRNAPTTASRNRVKLSLSDSVADHLRSNRGSSEDSDASSGLRASPTDKPRCPPKELLEQIDSEPVGSPRDEEDEEDEDDMETEDDEEADEVGSMVSSAGESSLDADDS